MNRRQFLGGSLAAAGSTALAADEKTTDGGFADVSWAERRRKATPPLPAGARGIVHFSSKCVGCSLCVTACPSKCLRLTDAVAAAPRVELDFRHGWCRRDCVKCSEVCPTGAIERISPMEKRLIHPGYALWRRDLCVRTTSGDECHACEKHCPVKAIKLVDGFPVVNRDACIGCGACEHYCPARPTTAISVVGYERHREIRPISEADLIDEMRECIAGGKAAVIARDGVIVSQLEGRGIEPLLTALAADKAAFAGALAFDRIVGRAAAALYIVGGARKVVASVMSEGAKTLLTAHGVESAADKLVPKIINRDQTGICPMDAKIEGLTDPREMYRRLACGSST